MKYENYISRLEDAISDYMNKPINQTTANAVKSMIECLDLIKTTSCKVGEKEVSLWVSGMENADGTTGEHWTKEETKEVAESMGITPDCKWYGVMNMMYSDYFEVASAYGVNTPDFYAEMAKAFIEDKDGKENKFECLIR